uniref:Uncharacterized protein n=1 Tax=Biomphalaria glabrata TaxID=6526 RepID=A0A2C9L931_BIOGL
MFDRIKSFRCKLTLWATQLAYGNLAHLSFLQSITVEPQLLKDYVDILSRLLEDFENRFQQFTALELQFFLVATPFAVDVKNVPEEVLQCDTVLKQKYAGVGVPDFYQFLPREKFPNLFCTDARILAICLGGTKQLITVMFDRIKSFRCKLTLWATQLAYGNLAHLSFLQSITVEPQLLKDYVDILSRLLEDFEHRFQQFTALEPQFFLVATPFAVDVKNVPDEVLQCDT